MEKSRHEGEGTSDGKVHREVSFNKHLRNSERGLFIKGYSFGRRFLTRGSNRPGRAGLTTSLGRLSFFISQSQRKASIKLIRSMSTP